MVNTKITYKQLIQTLLISRTIIAITTLPVLKSPPKNQDVWIAELLSFFLSILFSLPIYVLWRKFPNCSIIQYSRILLGKGGILIGVLIIWLFMHVTAITLAQLGEFLTVAAFQEAPRLFFILTMLVASSYAVYKGLEVIGRTSEFIAPVIIISVITISLFIMKEMELENLKPILEKGLLPVFYGGTTTAARTVETLALAMLLPNLNDATKAKKVIIYFNLLIVVMFILITVPVVTVLGVDQGKSSIFPYFYLIKIIDVGDFIERIDAIHLGIWVLGIYIRISFYFYLSVLSISQLFRFNDYRSLIFPVGSILIPLSILIAPSIVELNTFTSYKIFAPYILFFTFIIPSLLFIISAIRKKGEKLQ